MKDRIKQWYKDHEQDVKDTCIVGGSFIAVISISYFYGYINGKSRVDIHQFWSGSGEDINGETTQGFRVVLTNGREGYFFPPPVSEAA